MVESNLLLGVQYSFLPDSGVAVRNALCPPGGAQELVYCRQVEMDSALPDALHTVIVEHRIAGDDGQVFDLSLCGQHTVERVAVFSR